MDDGHTRCSRETCSFQAGPNKGYAQQPLDTIAGSTIAGAPRGRVRPPPGPTIRRAYCHSDRSHLPLQPSLDRPPVHAVAGRKPASAAGCMANQNFGDASENAHSARRLRRPSIGWSIWCPKRAGSAPHAGPPFGPFAPAFGMQKDLPGCQSLAKGMGLRDISVPTLTDRGNAGANARHRSHGAPPAPAKSRSRDKALAPE